MVTEISTKGYFFFVDRQISTAEASLPREAATKVSVIARDVLSLANTGGPGPAPIHHAVIDGKAKPLNAPNYLVNRAKCTTRAPARPPRRMTNERPVEYRRFRWDRAVRFRALSRDERRNGKPPLQVNPTASAIRVNRSPARSSGARTPFAVEGTPRITNDASTRAQEDGLAD